MTAEEILNDMRGDLDILAKHLERLREDFDGLVIAIAEGPNG